MVEIEEEKRRIVIVPSSSLSNEGIRTIHRQVQKRLTELMIRAGYVESAVQIATVDADFTDPNRILDLSRYTKAEKGILKFQLPQYSVMTVDYVELKIPKPLSRTLQTRLPSALFFKTGEEGSNTKARLSLHELWTYPREKCFLSHPVIYSGGETVFIEFTNGEDNPVDYSAIRVAGTLAQDSSVVDVW